MRTLARAGVDRGEQSWRGGQYIDLYMSGLALSEIRVCGDVSCCVYWCWRVRVYGIL